MQGFGHLFYGLIFPARFPPYNLSTATILTESKSLSLDLIDKLILSVLKPMVMPLKLDLVNNLQLLKEDSPLFYVLRREKNT